MTESHEAIDEFWHWIQAHLSEFRRSHRQRAPNNYEETCSQTDVTNRRSRYRRWVYWRAIDGGRY